MRQSYNLRSEIVHGEGEREFTISERKYGHKEISVLLESYARQALTDFLNLIIIHKKQKDLLKEFALALF